jgi:arylsulfatase A-like enzyme
VRHTNLAAELRKAGYRPVLFGYTDMSHDPRALPADDARLRTYEGVYSSFEIGLYLPEDNASWLDHLERRHGRRPSLGELFGGPLGAPAPYPAEDSETAFLADRFLAWLERRTDAAPWCAHLSFLKPHPPLVAPAPWHALYHPDQVPPPVRAAPIEAEARAHPWLAAKLRHPRGESWYGKPADLSEATIRRVRAVYYGLISEVDHHLGRILGALEARGERDRTLILFTSDHGEMLGDHWLLGKDGFFPQAFHVPLIIVDPAAEARGRVVEAFSEHVDLLPTLLDRLGLEIPLQCDGASLVPWLAGETPAGWREAAHFEHDFRDVETKDYERALGLPSQRCALAVRQSEVCAYVHFNGLPALCYDLAADPHQFQNIAADPQRAAEVLAQAQAMLTWRMDMAERRLTGCKLTPAGVIGRF